MQGVIWRTLLRMLVAGMLLAAGTALAQLTITGIGKTGGGVPVVPCGAGQLDHTDGCNTIWQGLTFS